MKKMETRHRSTTEKKLALHRETLRRLESAELRQIDAAGQAVIGISSPCGSTITTGP